MFNKQLKISFSLLIFLSTLFSLSSSQTPTYYSISDNYMHTYSIDLTSTTEDILLEFSISPDIFKGSKKSIFIYTDGNSKGYSTHRIWAGPISSEDESPYIYSDLDLTAFLFRQQDQKKTFEQFSMRIMPKEQGVTITIRVETSDEGMVFYTGERINRVFPVTFKYGYNDPFYIVSSYTTKKDAILYIEQESGLFPVDFLNEPHETHILPLETDKRIYPLKGHFSKLETKFEILHINRGEPGMANYYIVVEDQKAHDQVNEVNFIHLKSGEQVNIESFEFEEQTTAQVKIKKIMNGNKIKGTVDQQNFAFEENEDSKFFQLNKNSGSQMVFSLKSEEEDAIISITISDGKFYKVDSLYSGSYETKEKQYQGVQALLLTFPRFQNEREDYSSIEIKLRTTDGSDLNAIALKGKEYTDHLNTVPQIDLSCYFLYTENFYDNDMEIKMENPYDTWNVSEIETYYLAIQILSDPVPNIIVSISLKQKDMELMINTVPHEFYYLESEDDYLKRFLMLRNRIKNQGFYLMVHQCNYDSSRKDNVIMLNYFDEKMIWQSKISSEYQVFKLTNNYQSMDFQIGNVDPKIKYKDYILSYHQVSLNMDFFFGPPARMINQKIQYLKSRVYNFELLNGNKLSWYSTLDDDGDSSGIYVTDKEFLVCTLEDTEENRKYATNECFIQDMLNEEKIDCLTLTKQDIELNEGQKSYLIVVYEKVNLPVSVRYPIGIFKYGVAVKKSDQEDDTPGHDFGKYKQLVKGTSITAKAGEDTYMYFDLSDFVYEQQGIINIGSTEIKDLYYRDQFQEIVLATNLLLTESLFDEVLSNNKATPAQGESYYASYGYDLEYDYTELVFNKKRFEEKMYHNYVLIIKLSSPDENIKFNGVGEILNILVDQDLMISNTIPFRKMGIPVYVHIKISEENFQADKKGVFVYTDNIEKDYGNHQVYIGSPLEHIQYGDEPFRNYPLSAFKFRNEMNPDGEYEKTADSLTVVFYPKKIGVSVKLNVQTTDEGIVVYSGERVNRVFQALFTKGYDEPFYVVCTYPQISDAVLYVEQENGQFQIDMVTTASDSHLLPLPTDKSFIPENTRFSTLSTYFEILHISQVFPGKAMFHYILNFNQILNMMENSVEKIHIRRGLPFYLSMPSSSVENQKFNIKIETVMSTDPTESSGAYFFIEGNKKTTALPLGETVYTSVIIPTYDSKKTITFYAECDLIVFVTITMGDNIYKEVTQKGTTQDLSSKYLLYKFPKTRDYSMVTIKIQAQEYDEDVGFDVYAVTGIEKNANYIPDPRFSTNYLTFQTSGNRGNYFAMQNPYDMFKVEDDEFYFFSMVVTNYDYIPYYSITIGFVKKPAVEKVLSQEEIFMYDLISNKGKSFQLEAIEPNPEGIVIMTHNCGYKEELAMKNVLSLSYAQGVITKKYLNDEYNFITLANNYNGMNFNIDSSLEKNNYNNVIMSFIYEPVILKMITEDRYKKKITALQAEKYIFDYSQNSNELSWTCTNCKNDDSDVETLETNYLVCLLEDNLHNQEYLTNQCFIEEKLQKSEISCQRIPRNSISIAQEDLSKIIVVFKESKNPLLIRTFVGYYRYKDDNTSGSQRSVGNFVEINIGEKLEISNGKFFLKLSSDELEYLNYGVIAINSEKINGEIKAGFMALEGSESEGNLEKILEEGKDNVEIKLGEDSKLSKKITELIFVRETQEEREFYLVLDFDLESRTEIFISGPAKKISLSDNDMHTSLLHCYQANSPLYAMVQIEKGNYPGYKKGVFIYIDDIENNKGTHDIYTSGILSPEEIKTDYPLTVYLFRKDEDGDGKIDNEDEIRRIFIRIIPKQGGTSLSIRVQSTDEGVEIYDQERLNGFFDVTFTYSMDNPFYIVTSYKDYNDEYYLYIKQLTGRFPVTLTSSPSPSHIIPTPITDKHFIPLDGHYSQIKGYFTIIHVTCEMYGLAEFYFIPGQNKVNILPNSLTNLIVEYGNDNYYDLPLTDQSRKNVEYNVRLQCLMCNNTVTMNAQSNKIEIPKNGYYEGKISYDLSDGGKPKFSLHSNGGNSIISITVLNQNNLYRVIEKTTEGLSNQFILIKYPKNPNYESITATLKFNQQLSEDVKIYSNSGIGDNENYIPDPRRSFSLFTSAEEVNQEFEIYSINPYDYLNILENEFYYITMYIDSTTIPKYSITIKLDEARVQTPPKNAKSNEMNYLTLKTESTMTPIGIENSVPKVEALSIYVHSCRFDSKQSEKNKLIISYYESDEIWGTEINREYEIFTLTNEYSNINAKIVPYKHVQKNDYNDFILTYYLYKNQDLDNVPSNTLYNLKLDKLRSEKFIITVEDNKLKWLLDHEDVDKGNDGTKIPVNKRNFLICQLDNNERNKKYLTNECFIENELKDKKIKCEYTEKQEVEMTKLDKEKLVVVYQEVEFPIKARFYVGIFNQESYIVKSEYTEIFIALIIFMIMVLFIQLASLSMILMPKKKKVEEKPSMSMSEKNKENKGDEEQNIINNNNEKLV